MVSCKRCGDPIRFDDDVVSDRTGKRIPLDEDSDEPHNCRESEYFDNKSTIECHYCQSEIVFDVDYVTESGKKIPLDPETWKPHDCVPRRRATSKATCWTCKAKIYFDPAQISEINKKMIPMEVETGERHKCSK